MSLTVRAIEALSIVAAWSLVAVHVVRLGRSGALLSGWTPVLLPAGMLLADFASGLVHWTADTWGTVEMPFLGRRFLHPFRVHHTNPDDFLRRDPIDCNGDVAMLNLPILLALFLADPGSVAVFWLAFVIAALPTNQVHQWAHRPAPPRPVRWLQQWGLLLDPTAHRRHHREPHTANYCIATGWCNRPLTALGFFPALERLITRLTGFEPRADDRAFTQAAQDRQAARA